MIIKEGIRSKAVHKSNILSDHIQEIILPKELSHTVISITKNIREISKMKNKLGKKKEDKEIQDTQRTFIQHSKVAINLRRK